MQAVILAAGNSSRFIPFTSYPHKSMIDVMGKPLLLSTLASLKEAGITEVLLVVGKDSPIPHIVESLDSKTFRVRCIVQEEKLGMGHALLQARDYLEDTFFLLSAYHSEFTYVKDNLLKKQKDKETIVLLAKEDEILEKYGVIETDGENVLGIAEKISQTTSDLRVIGIYLLNKAFLETLSNVPLEHYHFEKALDMYAKKRKVAFVKANHPTFTLKYAWDILDVKDYFLTEMKQYISKKAKISKHAIIEGKVHISDGVQILEGACIKGPCYLGENVIVGNNAIIRGGVIAEKNVVIGATMEVKNSHLQEGVTTHTGFIGDSVIGKYSRLAAGFCSANVRFDRKHVWTVVKGEKTNTYRTHMGCILGEHVDSGTNVSIMPGVVIGNHVTIGPSTTVMENVEDNTIVYTKFETITKKQK